MAMPQDYITLSVEKMNRPKICEGLTLHPQRPRLCHGLTLHPQQLSALELLLPFFKFVNSERAAVLTAIWCLGDMGYWFGCLVVTISKVYIIWMVYFHREVIGSAILWC